MRVRRLRVGARGYIRWCLVSVLLAGAVSCVALPRDGEQLERKEVVVAGGLLAPDTEVLVRQWNFSKKEWSRVDNLWSSVEADRDPGGNKYYAFQGTRQLLEGAAHWSSAPHLGVMGSPTFQRRVKARLNFGGLTTFEMSATGCMERNWALGIHAVMINCGQTGPAEVFLKCGGLGEPCCEAFDIAPTDYCDRGRCLRNACRTP